MWRLLYVSGWLCGRCLLANGCARGGVAVGSGEANATVVECARSPAITSTSCLVTFDVPIERCEEAEPSGFSVIHPAAGMNGPSPEGGASVERSWDGRYVMRVCISIYERDVVSELRITGTRDV